MEFESIFSIFDKYGWAGLICVALVIILYYLLKNFNKENKKSLEKGLNDMTDKLSNVIVEQNKTLVDGMQETNRELLKHLLTSRDEHLKNIHNDSVGQREAIDAEISARIKQLFYSSHCDRIGILEFHNSKENLSGLSFLWYDMHYERQAKSLSAISDKVKDRQASALFPIIRRIAASKLHTIILHEKDLESLYDDAPVLYDDLVNKTKVKHIVYSGIYNHDNNEIMGLLVLEYHDDSHSGKFIEGLIEEVEDYAVGLSTALTFHHKLPESKQKEANK